MMSIIITYLAKTQKLFRNKTCFHILSRYHRTSVHFISKEARSEGVEEERLWEFCGRLSHEHELPNLEVFPLTQTFVSL